MPHRLHRPHRAPLRGRTGTRELAAEHAARTAEPASTARPAILSQIIVRIGRRGRSRKGSVGFQGGEPYRYLCQFFCDEKIYIVD